MAATFETRSVGTRPLRVDAVDKVLGRAEFGADVTLPGTLVGKVLRSPHAHARICGIETSAAASLPGVFAVVTGADFPPLEPRGVGDLARDNLALEKVLYHGHAVAAVAARNAATAEQALALIEVEYEVLEPVLDIAQASATGAPILHNHLRTAGADADATPTNVYEVASESMGDVNAGFAGADVIVEERFVTPTVHQGYIEPPACLAVWNHDAQSRIWTTTQGHFGIQQSVARMMDVPLTDLRVTPTEIGGGFGGKTAPYQEAIALMLSKKAARPVQMVMRREEIFRCAGPGAGFEGTVKIGAKADGTITAMYANLAYESGAFPAAPLGGGMRCIFSSYDVPNIYIEGRSVVVNKPKVRAYRGPGAPQATFAAESVVNMLAERLGMDPIELRLKNAVRNGATSIVGEFREIGLIECLEAARDSDHYQSPVAAGEGRAIALGFWRNGGNVSSAAVRMNADGTASVTTGSADLSGTRSALGMMAADTLGIEESQVSSQVGDTETIGFTSTSGGSRTINASGQAVVRAAQDVVAEMTRRAAAGWNVTPEQVEWRDGSAINTTRPGESMTAKAICKAAAQTGGPIAAESSLNVPPGLGPGFAVHVCDVAVDGDTGQVRVTRYTTVQDAGKAIHPAYVEGQLQGGAVQGIGWALNEEFIYSPDGVLENPGFLDYRVPLASDLPMIETVIVEVANDMHPFGVRGVGEAPIIPPLAAVAGAVSNAIGVRITELPCSPPRVLAAIQNADAST